MPPDASMQGQVPQAMGGQPVEQAMDAQAMMQAEGMPSLPTVDPSLLANPELQQQSQGNVQQ
jgi:hypothetical protein